MKKIMISGTGSGVGKTTIALGVMRALTNRGDKVQPFKVGPDYIDPSYHNFVTGRISRNLDSFMLDDEKMKFVFRNASEDASVSIIEGVMGLYDGIGADIDNCSSSYVAKILKSPVILVINAKAMGASAAAMVMGYKVLDKNVNIVGVICNNVKTENHFNILKQSIEKYCGIEVLGYLPPVDEFSVESRHLGLLPSHENEIFRENIDMIAEQVEKTIDLDRIVELAESESITSDFELSMFSESDEILALARGKKVAVAFDKAFNFYYEENLELMKDIGLEIEYFSPLEDERVPEADIIYIGGGFPEVFANELSLNISMKQSIREACESGTVVYAECGGLMYLGKTLKDKGGDVWDMVGVLDGNSEMTPSLKRFGYCVAKALKHTIISEEGEIIKGHEFHYSIFNTELEPNYEIGKEKDGELVNVWRGGYSYKNTLAQYIHTHFYNNLNLLVNLLISSENRE